MRLFEIDDPVAIARGSANASSHNRTSFELSLNGRRLLLTIIAIMISSPDGMRGVIRGKTIELERATDLPDGQVVSVIVKPAAGAGQALRRAFGSWAGDDLELDRHLGLMRQQRKSDHRQTGT